MFNYPYGDNQQINLNWIISEIIALHQRLDPDYTAPTFTQIYPFSDTQQLNLDWILAELKALKELAPTPAPTEEIDEIGQALIAGAYDADTLYQKNDYIVQDGKLYRANAATTGTFDPTKWNEVMLGNDLAIITRWADATNTYLNNLAASNVANDSSVTGTTVKDVLNNLNVAIISIKPTLNILVIGNSFDQDMFAYLPPVLNEMLPEYEINYCVLHQDSADFDVINTMYVNDTKFQYTNKWLYGASAWDRIPSSGDSWTLKQAIQAYPWDMVFMQATTADVASDTTIQNKIITPGRKLTRGIIANAIAPLNFYTIEWLARGASDSVIDSIYTAIHNGMIKTMQNLGFADYVPLGTAFQNARTNSTLKALGDGISMLYSDNIHVQAGAPALLGTYTLAAFIARKCGKPNGVYASSFQPTTANAEAINAKPSGSAVGMTHGDSTTITTVIKRALQEIVYITMNNPTVVTDCSSVTATPPT